MKEVISTPYAPQGLGPFSQAIRANGFVFVAGQLPIDSATREIVAGDVTVQSERVLQNLAAILRAAGSSLDKVVRAGVFLKSMDDFGRFNEVYARYFPADPPARTTVEVTRLPGPILVEIDVVALA